MSSSELYAEQNAVISGKAELNTSANEFISKCDAAIASANSVLSYCAGSKDTILSDSAGDSGAVGKLVNGIKGVKEKVSSALNVANGRIDQEIERLGAEAAAAAQREAEEAAAAQAAAEAAAAEAAANTTAS